MYITLQKLDISLTLGLLLSLGLLLMHGLLGVRKEVFVKIKSKR